jgi:hypothetical protein
MTRGIIIPILEKYEEMLFFNLFLLRNHLGCQLPIELWQIGQEISDSMKQQLENVKNTINISFKYVNDYTDQPEFWKGWQIKAFILKHTSFDEVILCDCDIYFLQNPEIIFKDPGYIKTGTYFFKDWLKHNPGNVDIEVPARAGFIRHLMPKRNRYFPEEWNYIYGLRDTVQSMWYYQESGVVYINKTMHPDVIETIYKLNENYKETYKYIYGDKETFWLACCMNDKPFCMNPIAAENYISEPKVPYINNTDNSPNAFTHFYNDSVFFSQKGYPTFKMINNKKNKPMSMNFS